jgi:DinB superfamily
LIIVLILNMQDIIEALSAITEKYFPLLLQMDERAFLEKPNPEKWSKKELLGHLADSAQNNIRRFVVAQYKDSPHIVYAQDNWVAAVGYQDYPIKDLINFWALLNKHTCIVLKNMPTGGEERLCETNAVHSLKWLAGDYVQHLLHHLHQILRLEPIPYP